MSLILEDFMLVMNFRQLKNLMHDRFNIFIKNISAIPQNHIHYPLMGAENGEIQEIVKSINYF